MLVIFATQGRVNIHVPCINFGEPSLSFFVKPHSVKSWDIHAEFCELLFKEFFNQGDIEREKGLPISPLCDRNTLHKPQSQISTLLWPYVSS